MPAHSAVRAMSSSAGPTSPYTTLAISHPAENITHVELHRPEKINAMNKAFWRQEQSKNLFKKKKKKKLQLTLASHVILKRTLSEHLKTL